MDKEKHWNDILNYYHYVENGTCLCDKAIILQSSNNSLSNFMQRFNFTKNKHGKKKVKRLGESIVIYQNLYSYVHHMLFTNNFYYFGSNNPKCRCDSFPDNRR